MMELAQNVQLPVAYSAWLVQIIKAVVKSFNVIAVHTSDLFLAFWGIKITVLLRAAFVDIGDG